MLLGAADTLRAAGAKVVIVSDRAGWALDDQAAGIAAHVPGSTVVGRLPRFVHANTIHFFNRYAALERDDLPTLAARRRLIVSWTHGGAGDVTPELQALAERMRSVAPFVHRVHVSASLYVPVVGSLGVPRERIRCVPFAIWTDRFLRGPDRREARVALGLPSNARVLGSFQRDGDDVPKLVKGPDRLVEAAARVHAAEPRLHVLLTGPARGYVRRELASRGVPFTYLGVLRPALVPLCYRACDAYLITAREEGGPLALLEAMASGTPVVTTPVGMVGDVAADRRNALVAADPAALADGVRALLDDPALASRLVTAARTDVERYDWSVVGPRYARELYAV
jgi:glycosyltransferase involved in cell wall biosynthesis